MVHGVTISKTGDITLRLESGTITYTPGRYELDGAFNPDLAAMALAISIAYLHDKISQLEDRLSELEGRTS